MKRYTVVLSPDLESGGFTVIVPALPGCITEGDTLDEALANAKAAIQLCLKNRKAHGEEIPDDVLPHITVIAVEDAEVARYGE
jgi:predicted RNase H-like HicB family nuclease